MRVLQVQHIVLHLRQADRLSLSIYIYIISRSGSAEHARLKNPAHADACTRINPDRSGYFIEERGCCCTGLVELRFG